MKKLVFSLLMIFVLFVPTQVFGVQKVPILVYHSIDEFHGHGSKELYVTPENFEKQILYLKNHGYTLLTFENWQDINKVEKPVFITLDDGYKNNENVFTIFQKVKDERFSPRATLFVISDFIGRQNRLSKLELKRMADSGLFSIQSHTATHLDLTKNPDFENELKGSKEKIQKITGRPVIALSYPYGNYNNRVISETKKYYQFGLTTTPSLYSKKGIENENFFLPRIYVKYSTTLDDFANIVK